MVSDKWFSHTSVNEDADVNLLLFTYAGGNSASFAPWKRRITKKVSFYPVLYPGRGRRSQEAIPDSPIALAENFVNENDDLFKKDFVFFSHCTGALIAYEVARYVKMKYGAEPKGFIASCSASPRISMFEEDVRAMSDEEFLQLLIESGRIDVETAKLPNFCQYYLPILKLDFIMIQNYHVTSNPDKLRCEFDTIVADNDQLVSPEDIADWQHFSEKTIRCQKVEGDHYYFEKKTDWICQYINTCIDDYLVT